MKKAPQNDRAFKVSGTGSAVCKTYVLTCGDVRRSEKRGCALTDLLSKLHFRNANVPDQSQCPEQPQGEPGDVQFPPGEAVARRDGMRVVIVVPAFAEGQQRHPPAVPRIIARLETPAAPHVGR